MRKHTNQTAALLPVPEAAPSAPVRNRLEIVRFPTPEDVRKAMGIFHEVSSADIYFTFRKDLPPNICLTNTATVRALAAHGFDFEWLTEKV